MIIDCHVHLNNYHEQVAVSLDESLDKLQAEMQANKVDYSLVLTSYLVPRRDIEGFLAEIRAAGYEMLRSPVGTTTSMADLHLSLSDLAVSPLRVDPGSTVAGRRLQETDLRRLFGITVVAIRRGEGMIPNPGGETVVEAGDSFDLLSATLDRSQPVTDLEHTHSWSEWAVWGAAGVLLFVGVGLIAIRRRKHGKQNKKH